MGFLPLKGEDPRRKVEVGGRGWRKVENGRMRVANWRRMCGGGWREVQDG